MPSWIIQRWIAAIFLRLASSRNFYSLSNIAAWTLSIIALFPKSRDLKSEGRWFRGCWGCHIVFSPTALSVKLQRLSFSVFSCSMQQDCKKCCRNHILEVDGLVFQNVIL